MVSNFIFSNSPKSKTNSSMAAKRVNTESFSSLPEPLIQCIQSFLSGKEAAQTTVLSKSWYRAWLTRPDVDFDLSDFHQLIFGDPENNAFSRYTRRVMQRYQNQNLTIDSFKLKIQGWERAGYVVASDLMARAVNNVGVTDLSFELTPPTVTFCLPGDVLGSESLTRLAVTGCKMEDVEVRCSGVKSLVLRDVWLEGDMIWNVLSRCPLIEELELVECKSFDKAQNFARNNYITTKRRMVALSPSSEIGNPNLGVRGRANLFELHKLKYLLIEKVKISSLFFSDFSAKFPCLKKLLVHYCYGYKEIQICSPSLEVISFAQKSALKANFDVPSIRKFTFSGKSFLPSLAFRTPSKEWESDISICCKSPSYLWFLNLNKLLTNLSSSTIHLSIDFQCREKSFDFTGEIKDLPVVQNLTMHASNPVCSDVLDGIFWICRPMFVTQQWMPGMEQAHEDLLALLFKSFTREGRIMHPFLRDLEEVYCVEQSHAMRRRVPEYERTLSFELIWKQ